MKWHLLVLLTIVPSLSLGASEAAAASSGHGAAPAHAEVESLLTPEERALVFSDRYLRTDDQGKGLLVVDGEPLSQERILSLSAWDTMQLVQRLASTDLPLSRFGHQDKLTQAWRDRVVAFAASADHHSSHHAEDPFDPGLVLWDPGTLQTKNEWGQWTIRIANRSIVQGDLERLSPLEVQQAVEVLTGRTYPVEYVLEHLEAFRAQLSIVPRVVEPVAAHH